MRFVLKLAVFVLVARVAWIAVDRAEGASRAASSEVVVFTSDRCDYCAPQLRDLDAAGIPYRERNVDRDADAARELARHDRRRPVPTTVLGDRVWQGYNPSHAAAIGHARAFASAPPAGPTGVVLYTQATCGLSKRLMAELDRLGVDYENRDIDRSDAARDELVRLTGRPGVPVAVVGGELLPGWSPERAREIQARADPDPRGWPF